MNFQNDFVVWLVDDPHHRKVVDREINFDCFSKDELISRRSYRMVSENNSRVFIRIYLFVNYKSFIIGQQ